MATTETVTTPTPTPAGTSRTAGLAIGLGSAASFALSGSFGHALLSLGWSPTALVATRVGGAFLVLLVPCLLVLRRTGLPTLRQSGRLLVYGLVAVAGAQLFYFSSLQYLSVGVALLLEYLAPVLLIFWHWAHDRRRPTRSVLLGAVLAVLGLVFVLDLRSGFTLDPVGVAWGLGAAVCLCGYFVLAGSDGHAEQVSPVLLTTAGLGVGGLLIFLLGAVGVLPLVTRTGSTVLAGAAVGWWLPALLLVGITAVLAYLTGVVAVRRLGSSVASFVSLAEVVFAVAFAIVLLGQQPSPGQLLGGLLVLAGIVVVQRGGRRAAPTS